MPKTHGKREQKAQPQRIELNYYETLNAKSNLIVTTKYKWYSFLLLFLFQQYQKASNVFYLIYALCNLIPGTSVVTPASAFVPVIFVLLVAAVREILEDISRLQGDRYYNSLQYTVIRGGKAQVIKSCEIKQGDLLILQSDDEVPADSVLLYSSEESKVGFINTASLDGESNLKIRNALTPFSLKSRTQQDIIETFKEFYGRVTVPPPSNDMHNFNGKLYMLARIPSAAVLDIENQFEATQEEGLYTIEYVQNFKLENVLLRGVRLKNTACAVCGVVYTAGDTRLMQNQMPSKYKTSRLDDRINYLIFLVTMLALVFIVGFAVAGFFKDFDGIAFFEETTWPIKALQRFVQYLIISSYLLPISLFVTIEFIRLFQSILIDADARLRLDEVQKWIVANPNKKIRESPFAGDNPAYLSVKIKNSISVENLAEVDLIFTDKTGTLTKNQMTFHSMVGSDYCMQCVVESMRSEQPIAGKPDLAFVFGLALCNTVLPQEEAGRITYQAESPDEIAFVQAAARMGLVFTKMYKNMMCFELKTAESNRNVAFNVLAVIPFSSARKKMSIVLQEIGYPSDAESAGYDGELCYYLPESIASHGYPFILMKGADSFVLPYIAVKYSFSAYLQQDIDYFSDYGLRTLVFGGRALGDDFYDWLRVWQDIYQLGEEAPDYAEHVCKIEQDLQFVGVSAVEDELQDELNETLTALLQTGIKVWVLTGDKTQTAINIARSAGLSYRDSDLIYLTAEHLQAVTAAASADQNQSQVERYAINMLLDRGISQYVAQLGPQEIARYYIQLKKAYQVSKKNQSKASWNWRSLFVRPQIYEIKAPITVVLDSVVFKLLVKYNLQYKFFHVALYAQSVVCCRLSPQEKALIVNLAHDYYPFLTTMAVGDGANDVVMIKTAQIGVGVAGREGMHACNNSDISVPAFRYLKRLIFVHGRTTHFRNSQLVDYCIFKNSIISFLNFTYANASLRTGAILSEPLLLMMFNTLMTFLPIAFYSMIEKEVYDEEAQSRPESLKSMYRRYCPNVYTIIADLIYGFFCSQVIYYMSHYAFGSGMLFGDGYQLDLYGQYTVVMSCICLVAILRVYTITKIWNWLILLLFVLSFAVFYFTLIFGNYLTWFGNGLLGYFPHVIANPAYLTQFIAITTICLMPGLLFTSVYRFWIPHIGDIQMGQVQRGCECVDEQQLVGPDTAYTAIIYECSK